jgi:hypothetical protein
MAGRLNLCRVKTALGHNEEVEKMLLEGIPIASRNLTDKHFGTIAARHFYAQFLVRQERYSEAENILVDVIDKQIYSYGAQKDGYHPDRLMAMYHLVGCFERQGKIEKAFVKCVELDEILKKRKSIHRFAQWVRDKRGELEAARRASANEGKVVDSSAEDGSPVGLDQNSLREWGRS